MLITLIKSVPRFATKSLSSLFLKFVLLLKEPRPSQNQCKLNLISLLNNPLKIARKLQLRGELSQNLK